ncbi:hypothetical protein DM01DRAFT_253265 [Hesseltinella vesiculosa]|uniref:PHD-type domain-containing protein n=1 Tax=Hesseltinella vesiculosa TaxID=101127 RepID=A0A1X2GX43_9FUNG|nr:hypothetical protein DM01DRAFT_253265 [Hesseltinella vesiculosa]
MDASSYSISSTEPIQANLSLTSPIEPLFDGIDLDDAFFSTPPANRDDNNDPHATTNPVTPSKHILPLLKRKRKQPDHSTSMKKRPRSANTLFEQLSLAGIDWCRYCGTTEGVNWRPGPWGKRTLCNKHGCDYKGYGLASRMPRLDLSKYRHERIQDRGRPVIQEFCATCQERGDETAPLVPCDGGCSRAFHSRCFTTDKENPPIAFQGHAPLWFCSPSCQDNRSNNRVGKEPRKKFLFAGFFKLFFFCMAA